MNNMKNELQRLKDEPDFGHTTELPKSNTQENIKLENIRF